MLTLLTTLQNQSMIITTSLWGKIRPNKVSQLEDFLEFIIVL